MTVMTLEMAFKKALAALTAKDNELADANATILSLRQENASRTLEIASLKRRIEWFARQLFGTWSEKRMFDSPEQGPDMF